MQFMAMAGLITSHHRWNKIKSFTVEHCLLFRGSKFFLCWLPSLFSVQHNSFTKAFFCVTGSPKQVDLKGFGSRGFSGLIVGLVSVRGPILARKGWVSDIGCSVRFSITPGSSRFNSFSLLLFNEFIMELGKSTSE